MTRKSIVIGVKEKQATALRFAAQVATEQHSTLRIVHCLDVRTAADFVSVPPYTCPPESWRAAGEVVIDAAHDFVKGFAPSLAVECVVSERLPYQSLHDEAADASMLVVGLDAASLFGPLFGGSVTERLITHSNVPVAVVPERPWPDEVTGPIFVAIDTRSPAKGPLRFAFDAAQRSGLELHVAHVIPESDMFFRSQSPKIAVSEVLAGWSEEFPDVIVKHRFFFDDAEQGCLRASEEASLLVLGHRKTQIFGHPVLTEIAQGVHCPCVVVPDEWEGA